jgi:hypothetical protein
LTGMLAANPFLCDGKASSDPLFVKDIIGGLGLFCRSHLGFATLRINRQLRLQHEMRQILTLASEGPNGESPLLKSCSVNCFIFRVDRFPFCSFGGTQRSRRSLISVTSCVWVVRSHGIASFVSVLKRYCDCKDSWKIFKELAIFRCNS